MSHTKVRLTISLSREAARFLKALQAQAKSPSMSALIEGIVAGLKSGQELEQLHTKTSAYYDALSAAAISEDAAWGQLGEAALGLDQPETVQSEARHTETQSGAMNQQKKPDSVPAER